MLYMFLAEGFEETEAIVTLDILRRANISVITVGVGGKTVKGAHGVPMIADTTTDEINKNDCDGIILPGGMPGTLNLENDEVVIDFTKYAYTNSKLVCAICAAPSVLGHLGILDGKSATCYPGFEKDLFGATPTGQSVTADGNIITGRGPGAAFDFGFKIVEILCGTETKDKLRASMQCIG